MIINYFVNFSDVSEVVQQVYDGFIFFIIEGIVLHNFDILLWNIHLRKSILSSWTIQIYLELKNRVYVRVPNNGVFLFIWDQILIDCLLQ